MELKVLASDKITAYHNYVSLHERLFECADLDDCFSVAKNLLKNYRQNREIFSEFAYYQEHGCILGKHPVFAERKKLDSYRKLGIYQLTLKKRNLEHAIWRIRAELKRGDKPHLDAQREQRLAGKLRELAAVTEIINTSEKK
ncbi:MAG: hypothetical protein IJ222_03415 [Bacteroidales bacterium]|nr:hypothetical protein [Bacteroidales bacterium]